MKRIYIILMLSVMMCLSGMAQTMTTFNDILYEVKDGYAIVARQDKNLAGDIVVPHEISYNGSTIPVTGMVEPTLIDVYGDNTVDTENGAFQNCGITSITLPTSIQVVTAGAFQDCKQLKSVTLPEGLTTLGAGCFARCTALTAIALPSSLTNLYSETPYGDASFVFGDCTALQSVNIPEGVTRILGGCFKNTAISEFILPEGLTELCDESLASTALTLVKTAVRDLRTLSYTENIFADVSEATLQVPYGSQYIYREHEPWMLFKKMEMYGDENAPSVQPDQRHVEVGGLKYLIKLTDEGCWALVDRQDASLSGPIAIPESIMFEGTSYPVRSFVEPKRIESFASGEVETSGGAFQGTQITSLTVPSAIATIPAGTFSDCQQLTTVVLGEGVRQLGAACFANCTSLKTLSIPEGVEMLGRSLLKGSAIETLTVPAQIKMFEDYSLDLPQLKALTLLQEDMHQLKVAGYTFGSDNSYLKQADLKVPLGSSQVYGEYYPWLDFHSVSDVNCSYLELDGSILSAPESAFTVDFPEGMADEDKYEVHGNGDYLKGLNLKQGVTVNFTALTKSWVYVYLFRGNSNTVNLDGTELTNIGDDGQTDYRRYDRLVEPGEHTITCNNYEGNQWPCLFLLEVEDATATHRFEPNEKIAHIDNVRYMLDGDDENGYTATIARQNKSLVGDIVVPEIVKYEGKEYVVSGMVAPTRAEAFADAVFETTDGAFQNCQITSISLPGTIEKIEVGAFNGCTELQTVTLADGIKVLGAASFANCTSLTELTLPETVTDLGCETDFGFCSYVFGNCTSLKKVNIPIGVTVLAGGCFQGSGIETFLIPENIKELQPGSFNAPGLQNIKICHKSFSEEGMKNLSFTESVFDKETIANVDLYVPEGSKELYEKFYPWKEFRSITEYTDQNDELQYNAYRVSYVVEKEGTAAPAKRFALVRRAAALTAPTTEDTELLGYTPSGILIDKVPVLEGYVFKGWKEDLPDVMPANDLILTAIFERAGIATPIQEINANAAQTSQTIYSLEGKVVMQAPASSDIQRSLRPGIYIVDGRKVVVK